MPKNKAFNKLMSAIESDHNPKAKHRTIASGIHEGTSGMRESALMPKTAQDVAKKLSIDEVDDIVSKIDPSGVPQVMEDNPHKYDEYVNKLTDDVMARSKGDPVDGAVRWRWGQNMPNQAVNEVKEANPQYLERIEKKIAEQGLASQAPTFGVPALDQQPVDRSKNVIYSRIREMMGKK